MKSNRITILILGLCFISLLSGLLLLSKPSFAFAEADNHANLSAPLPAKQSNPVDYQPQSVEAGTAVQTIELQAGWNLISSYIAPDDPDLDVLLVDIAGDLVLLKKDDGQVYWPAQGIDDISQWQVTEGYQVYMSNSAVLTISGVYVSPASTPQVLPAGWNTIAYHRDTGIPIADALASIGDQLLIAKNGMGEVYWPEYDVDQIGSMQSGQGYQVYLNDADTLTYPSGGTTVCGTISEDTTWTAANSPYLLNCSLTVSQGITLTLEAGTQVKLSGSININGGLVATDEPINPITFTSVKDDSVGGDTNNDGSATTPVPGDWYYIVVRNGGQLNMSHASLRFGGYSSNTGMVHLDNGSTAVLDNVILSDSKYYGVDIDLDSSAAESASLTITNSTIVNTNNHVGINVYGGDNDTINLTTENNTFNSNRGALWMNLQPSYTISLLNNSGTGNNNAVYLSGTVGSNLTLPTNAGMPYVISSSLSVPSGVTLAFQPGAIAKVGSNISVYGTLLAPGTAANPITFTSVKDDSVGGDTNNDGSATTPVPGDWYYIVAGNGGQLNMSHASLRFGGYSSNTGMVHLDNGSTAVLDNVILSDSKYYGVDIDLDSSAAESASLTITNSTIVNTNNHVGINVYGGDNDTINLTTENNTFNSNRGALWMNLQPSYTISLLNNSGTGNNNAVYLSGTVGSNLTLPTNAGMPYVISSSLSVPSGVTLAFQPGAIAKVGSNIT